MRFNFKTFLFASAVALAPFAAFAQSAVQQTTQDLRASTGLYGQSNGASSCNSVSQTAAQDTVTITPPGSQYVYVDAILITKSTDATGVTEFQTLSTTNLTGAPFFDTSSTLTTTGQRVVTALTFPNSLKATAPGTAVTFVPSATQSAHGWLCIVVAAHFGS
jgi:hypothetical protein